MCGGAAHDHHGNFARVEVEVLAFTHCFAGCVERSHKHLLHGGNGQKKGDEKTERRSEENMSQALSH